VSSTVRSTATVETGIPSDLPKVITPNGGLPKRPDESQLIRIGFNYGLNYPFVVQNPIAVAQVFDYLPKGLSYHAEEFAARMNLQSTNVTVQSLQPYDSQRSLGFIRTLAYTYIPKAMVNQLQVDIGTPNSVLYQNPDPSVNALMAMIDPTIPLIAPIEDAAAGGKTNGGTVNQGDT